MGLPNWGQDIGEVLIYEFTIQDLTPTTGIRYGKLNH
jgi:hypothetical protein